jgi:hypothetical protein
MEQVEQICVLEEKLRVAKLRASVEEKNTADAFHTAQQATAMLDKVKAKKLQLKAAVSRRWYYRSLDLMLELCAVVLVLVVAPYGRSRC